MPNSVGGLLSGRSYIKIVLFILFFVLCAMGAVLNTN